MKLTPKQIKRIADDVAGVLDRQIKITVDRHAKLEGLSAEQRERLYFITEKLLETLQVNVVVNAKLAGLPSEVVLTTVLESISGWSLEIDKMAGKAEHSRS